ncbi:MAG TPA: adenylate/guanylate cyclase domain-containing protein [Trichocoleus sp.]
MENRVLSTTSRHRLLAAIMMTDAVGFSARMSVDEELTLRLIDRDLKLIGELCEAYEGTLLKTTGDGVLVYFVSAVQAVSCGLEVQRRMADLMREMPHNQFLMHRIGIHLGDILVSEADVMGNGVNIAARLQTYAKPGGLCISQTIYDVVKARLQLNATFLGPLHLKNIQEPVPAYQVDLYPEEDTSSALNETTQPIVVAPDGLLQNATTALTDNINHQRIKKLIFAACQQAWENDPAVLDQFELRSLLETLRQRYPTLPALKARLSHIVSGLNRRASYEAVAAAILMQLEPWYRHTADSTQLVAAEWTTLSTTSQSYQGVAGALKQTADFQRLRKLLYCICYNVWENDPNILESVRFDSLVQQTRTVAPTPQDLKYHLSRVVKRLNRKTEYTRLANIIIEQFQPLYSQRQGVTQLAAPLVNDAVEACTEMTSMEPQLPAAQEMTTLHGSLSIVGVATEAGVAVSAPVPSAAIPAAVRDRTNLFELRQDIMRYTNPLRAKVLLYSCLNGPFGYSRQDWSTLKEQALDQLITKIFEYCPTFSDLESKLSILSHCLDNADENVAVAGTIAQVMKAYYPVDGISQEGVQAAPLKTAMSHPGQGAGAVPGSTPTSQNQTALSSA